MERSAESISPHSIGPPPVVKRLLYAPNALLRQGVAAQFQTSNFDTDGIRVQIPARCRKTRPDLRTPTCTLPLSLSLTPGAP